jgi:hypothetical protein
MANPHKGELRLVAGDRSYTLRLTTNACVEVEDLAKGRTIRQIFLGVATGSIRDIRLLVWAALRHHHPDVATDHPENLKAIGALLDSWGEIDGVVEQLQALIGLNTDPGPVNGKGKSGKKDPRKAQVGTGVASDVSVSPSA